MRGGLSDHPAFLPINKSNYMFNLFNFAFIFDGSKVNLLIAFAAGFITFFASCLLPLVPTYLAYLSGISLNSPESSTKRWYILQMASMFVLGFITTFVILGLSLQQFAGVIAPYRLGVERAAGLLFIVLGLFMLGVFKHAVFTTERRFNAQGLFTKYAPVHALLTGVAFGFGWTPCIGPVLAVILYWSAQQASVLSGAALLITYGLGLGLPFLLVAVGFEKAVPFLKKHAKVSYYTNIVSAVVIMLVGLLMVSGQFRSVSFLLLELLNLPSFAT
jgi:cytochrome c-type biogenesis protein